MIDKNNNDTFDLNKLFKSEDEFQESIYRINKLLGKIGEFKGHILDNSDTLRIFLNTNNELDISLERIYLYSHLGYDNNMNDSKWQEKKDLSLSLLDKSSEMESYILPELLKSNLKDVNKLLTKDLQKYVKYFEMIFRYKEHTLSEKEEIILSNTSEILRTPTNVFNAIDNIDIYLGTIIDENNKKIELTNANYGTYIASKNRRVRRSAFNKLYTYYKNHIYALSSSYAGSVKGDIFESKIRKYNSSLEESLFSDNVNKTLIENLFSAVDDNIKYLKKYYKLKSKALNLNKLHMYDTYVNIANVPNIKINYEEGKKIVLESLNPLGKDYIKNITYLLSNRCVDVYPKKNKKSGAYQISTYRIDPYVSLNYDNNIDSVSTLAHEMGHAMHSYYSDLNNDYIYVKYPIFLAEIASTVNENLLLEYLSKNAKTKEEKKYYLVEYLDRFKSTVYRQTMFEQFEYIIHDKCEKNESITKDVLCDTYYELVKKQFSGAVVIDENIKYEWSRIPHFYTSFYVYKYATGFICAEIIANKLLNEKDFNEKYIEFLKSGGKDYPLEILNNIGIDLTDEKVLNSAFNTFNKKLEELDKLLKESGE